MPKYRGNTGTEEALELLYPHISDNEKLQTTYDAILSKAYLDEQEEIDSLTDFSSSLQEVQENESWSPVNLCSSGLPTSVVELGTYRKLKFEIDFGVRSSRQDALTALHNQASHYEYLSFVKCTKLDVSPVSGNSTAEVVAGIIKVTSQDFTVLGRALARLGSRVAVLGDEILSSAERNKISSKPEADESLVSFELARSRKILQSGFGRNLVSSFSISTQYEWVRHQRITIVEDIVGSLFESASLAA